MRYKRPSITPLGTKTRFPSGHNISLTSVIAYIFEFHKYSSSSCPYNVSRIHVYKGGVFHNHFHPIYMYLTGGLVFDPHRTHCAPNNLRRRRVPSGPNKSNGRPSFVYAMVLVILPLTPDFVNIICHCK